MFNKTILSVVFLLLWQSVAFTAEKSDEKVFFEGIKYFRENNFKKAETSFKKVIKTNFGHYPSYFNLSLLYLTKKDYKKSIGTLLEAKKFNPFDIRVEKMLASAYLMNEELEEAKKYISSIIFKIPADIYSHKKLGIIYTQENSFKDSSSEFAMVKNLDPADLESILLLSISYAYENNFSLALEKLTEIKDKLTGDLQIGFYGFVLEKNNLPKEAQEILKTIKEKPTERLIEQLTFSLKESTVFKELAELGITEDFAIPEVSQRVIEQIKKEEEIKIIPTTSSGKKTEKKKLPLGLKATVVETFEIYKRKPATTSPINGAQTTSNLKLEGKGKENLSYYSQWEWFYNRWDHTVLDYYTVNFKKSDYEVDVGKFSSKHFPTLVNHPTVIDGLQLWRKFSLPDSPTKKTTLPQESNEPINLGEIYRQAYIDEGLFKTTEFTWVIGRTLDHITLAERKQKNENTYETSGQFEQWTQAYRLYSQVTPYADIGTSLAITEDRSESITASTSTYPISSSAFGFDGAFKFLDKKLTFDWETALSDYDENLYDKTNGHLKDKAWSIKSKYQPRTETTFSYEQKTIKKGFKVEGAYQTEDKISHTINAQYQPSNPKTWDIKSLTLKFQPEETNFRGGGATKKKYKTFQPVISFKLPQDAKLTSDYKYYREYDKCACTNYRTRTLKTDLDWEIKKIKTTIKPYYTFERKDDRISADTAEKSKEFSFSIENTSIKNLTLNTSATEERKGYIGSTTKSYRKKTYSIEPKYTFIPGRCDLAFKVSREKKHPTDTNKTELTTLTLTFNLSSKSGDDKLTLKYERKNNIYQPWSDTSAYRQNYAQLKYTRKF